MGGEAGDIPTRGFDDQMVLGYNPLSRLADYEASLGGKWLELLSEIAPGLKRAAIMFNPDTAPVSAFTPSLDTAARSLKVAPSRRAVEALRR